LVETFIEYIVAILVLLAMHRRVIKNGIHYFHSYALKSYAKEEEIKD
jgi:hypothetical protein